MNVYFAGFVCSEEAASSVLFKNFILAAIMAYIAYVMVKVAKCGRRSGLRKIIYLILLLFSMALAWLIFAVAVIPWGCNTFPFIF